MKRLSDATSDQLITNESKVEPNAYAWSRRQPPLLAEVATTPYSRGRLLL
jgi:hypothetical protein